MHFDKNNWFIQSLFTQVNEKRNAVSIEIASIIKNVLDALEQRKIPLTPEQEEDLKLQVCMNALEVINALVISDTEAGVSEDDFHDLFGIRLEASIKENVRSVVVFITPQRGASLEIKTTTVIDTEQST